MASTENAMNIAVPSGSWPPSIAVIHEFNADYKKRYPLHHAAMVGDTGIVNHMVKKSKISSNLQDFQHRTPLHLAAYGGQLEIIKLLIKLKAKPNAADVDGWTPIHYAAENSQLSALELLLSMKKVRADMTTTKQFSALHLLVAYGRYKDPLFQKMYLKLTASGLSTNMQNAYGETCLHLACTREDSDGDLVSFVIDQRADILLTDREGETCLHRAARCGNVQVVKLLIRARAKPTTLARDGKSPIDIAEALGHYDVLAVLDSKRAGDTVRKPKVRNKALDSASTSVRYASWSANSTKGAKMSSPSIMQRRRPQAMYSSANSLPFQENKAPPRRSRSGSRSNSPAPATRSNSFHHNNPASPRGTRARSPSLLSNSGGSLTASHVSRSVPSGLTMANAKRQQSSTPSLMNASGAKPPPRISRLNPTTNSSGSSSLKHHWVSSADASCQPIITRIRAGSQWSALDMVAIECAFQVRNTRSLLLLDEQVHGVLVQKFNEYALLAFAHMNLLSPEAVSMSISPFAADILHPLTSAHALCSFDHITSALRALSTLHHNHDAVSVSVDHPASWSSVCILLESLRLLGLPNEAVPFGIWLFHMAAQYQIQHQSIDHVRKYVAAWLWFHHARDTRKNIEGEVSRLHQSVDKWIANPAAMDAVISALLKRSSPIPVSVDGVLRASESLLDHCLQLELWNVLSDPRALTLSSISPSAERAEWLLARLLGFKNKSISSVSSICTVRLLESLLVPLEGECPTILPWSLSTKMPSDKIHHVASQADLQTQQASMARVLARPECLAGLLYLCRPASDTNKAEVATLCGVRALAVGIKRGLIKSSPEVQGLLFGLLHSTDPQLQYNALISLVYLPRMYPESAKQLLANNVYGTDALLIRLLSLLQGQPHGKQTLPPTTGERVVLASLVVLATLLHKELALDLANQLLPLGIVPALSASLERTDCVLAVCACICRMCPNLVPSVRASLLEEGDLLTKLLDVGRNSAEIAAAQHAAVYALCHNLPAGSLGNREQMLAPWLSKVPSLDLSTAKLRIPDLEILKIETILEISKQTFIRGYRNFQSSSHADAQKLFSSVIVSITSVLRTYREAIGSRLADKARRLLYQCMCSSALIMMKRSDDDQRLLNLEARIKFASVAGDLYRRALENFPGDPLAAHQMAICQFRLAELLVLRYAAAEDQAEMDLSAKQATERFAMAKERLLSVPQYISAKVEELSVTGYDPASHYYSYNEFDLTSLRVSSLVHEGSVIRVCANFERMLLAGTGKSGMSVSEAASAAMKKYEEALALNKDCVEALIGLSACKRDIALSDLDKKSILIQESRKFLERALEIQPRNAIAAHDLAALDLDQTSVLPTSARSSEIQALIDRFQYIADHSHNITVQKACQVSLHVAKAVLP